MSSDLNDLVILWNSAEKIVEELEILSGKRSDVETLAEAKFQKRMREVESLLVTLTHLRKERKLSEKELYEREKRLLSYLPEGWDIFLIVEERDCRYAISPSKGTYDHLSRGI